MGKTRQDESPAVPRPPAPGVLDFLLDETEGLRASVYVPLPEHRGFDEVRAFPASFELAAKAAGERMAELGASEGEVEQALSRLASIDADVASMPRATQALGVFLGPGGVEAFALAHVVDRAVHVGRSFRVRPLLRAARREVAYRALAVSTNRVALFEGDARGLREVRAAGVPRNLEDALGGELSERQLHYHSSATAGEAVIYHGHGGASRGRSIDQERFHRVVSRAVAEHWNGRDDPSCWPLVLATDEANDGSFRKLAALPGLLEGTAAGNADRLSDREVHERTWPIVETWLAGRDAAAVRRARDTPGLTDLEPAIEAAAAGRVARLWVDARERVPGHVDLSSGRLTEGFGDEDALDELATLVFARRGEVHVLEKDELPASASVLAELRG